MCDGKGAAAMIGLVNLALRRLTQSASAALLILLLCAPRSKAHIVDIFPLTTSRGSGGVGCGTTTSLTT